MNIVFHLGVHCTDGGLLMRSLLQNRAALAEDGIGVPGPLRYRELLGETSTSLRGDVAPPETEALILSRIAPTPDTERVVLSNENFLCRSQVALGRDCLYPKAMKSAWLRNCVPSHDVEFAIALRNPACFLPDLVAGHGGPPPPHDMLAEGVFLDDLLWSDVIWRIAEANPTSRITAWCHEDTPFIWPQIQRELTGLDPTRTLDGGLDMAETIMTSEGYARLTGFLESRNVGTEDRRRRAIAAFLEAHAIEHEIETEIDLPGWTDETVETLTTLYETDVAEIARMPNVNFISP